MLCSCCTAYGFGLRVVFSLGWKNLGCLWKKFSDFWFLGFQCFEILKPSFLDRFSSPDWYVAQLRFTFFIAETSMCIIVAQRIAWVYWWHLAHCSVLSCWLWTYLSCWHVYNCCAAYGMGLLLTFAALAAMGRGQPALLYIVPVTLGTSVLVGWRRGELRQLWTGQLTIVSWSTINNNNNNKLICIAPVCRLTSEALDGQLQCCHTARAWLNVLQKRNVFKLRLNRTRELEHKVSVLRWFQMAGAERWYMLLAKWVLVVGLWSSGVVKDRHFLSISPLLASIIPWSMVAW